MNTDQSSSFGAHLRRYRERAGLTQEALAEQASLTANAIGALERGERRHPYPHTVRALADALGLSDDERTVLATSASRTERPSAARHEAGASVASPRPPVQLTSLVGRTAEAAVIGQLLRRADVRLLTLTGPGGVGKTRLAIEVAATWHVAFADGVAFVALAPIGGPALVLPTIAQTLGLQETGGISLLRSLTLWLQDKHLLVLVDNFEHVAAAAPQLAELLQTCAGLKLLVTSRAALRIRGEQEYPVPPLAFPRLDDSAPAGDLLQFDAIRLFVQRAQAVRPEFALTTVNGAQIAQICARLDGLPLAIELAAARTSLLSPPTLLARLERQLQVLTGGARDLPARQQTMRATIAWSYDLLTPAEQTLFRRLAIFAGGATLEAIETVCGGGVDTADELLDQVASLVQENLARHEAPDNDESRIGMLETIRAYGLEQLQRSGEAAPIAHAHAQAFLALAERAAPALTRRDQDEWFQRLNAEINNLRAAMRWWLDQRAWTEAVRLTWALWRFWWIRGLHREALAWMAEVLAQAAADALAPLHRAQAELTVGSMAWAAGDHAEAQRWCEQSLARSADHGDQRTEAITLMILGVSTISRGDFARTATWLERSAQLFRALGEDWGAGFALSYPGLIAIAQGDVAGALPALEEGLALARRSGDRVVTHQVLYSLGIAATVQGDHLRAVQSFHEGLTLAIAIQDIANVGYFIKGLAELAAIHADAARGLRLLGAAHALLEAIGVPFYRYALEQPWHARVIPHIRAAVGDTAFEREWAAGRLLSVEQAQAEAQALGRALVAQLAAWTSGAPPQSSIVKVP